MQTNRLKSILKSRLISILLAVAATVLLPTGANATSVLYGITGDGASTPSTLYTLSKIDATSTFVLSLGAGDDGETIGFNPADGLMYHSSGISDGNRFWESINLNTTTIVSSGQFTGPNVTDENPSMVYDVLTDRFLVGDRNAQFFSVTTSGVATDIGDTPENLKGLAFVDGTLYGAAASSASLYAIDPSDGSSSSLVTLTLPGLVLVGANGLATDPDTGILWGVLRDSVDRHLVTIEPTTGIATLVGTLDDKFAGVAFASSAVPIPATVWLFGSAVGLLAWTRRKAA